MSNLEDYLNLKFPLKLIKKNMFFKTLFLLGLFSQSIPAERQLTVNELVDLSLEELLKVKIASSGYFEPNSRLSPGVPWILTQNELRLSPVIHLRDVFEHYVPSTTLSYTHFAGPKTAVRGIDTDNNAKTVFMLNGQNLNPKNHYGYQAGLQSVLLGDIDHLEIIHGPGSLLHGSGAINSVVNVVSKNGTNNRGSQLRMSYGFKEQLKSQELGHGLNYGKGRDLYVYAGWAQSDGFEPDNFLERSASDFESDAKFGKVYQMPKHQKFSAYLNWDSLHFQTQYQSIVNSRNNLYEQVLPGRDDLYWQKYWASRLDYVFPLSNYFRLKLSFPVNFIDHGVHFYSSEASKGGSQVHLASRNTLFFERNGHQLALGFGFKLKKFDAGNQYFGENTLYTEEIIDAVLKEAELYTEYNLQISPTFSVIAGARLDYVEYSDMGLVDKEEVPNGVNFSADNIFANSYRLAFAYLPGMQHTFKVSYQEGFRYPDIGYFRYIGMINASLKDAGFKPIGQLKAEKVGSLQFNYLHHLKSIPLNFDATVYYNRYSNVLDWAEWPREMFDSDEEYRAAYAGIPWNRLNDSIPVSEYYVESYRNTGDKIDSWGVDLGTNLLIKNKIQIRGSYGFSRPGPTNPSDATLVLMNAAKDRWASYPEHLLKLSFSHNPKPQIGYQFSSYFASPVDICNEKKCASSEETVEFHERPRLRVNCNVHYTFAKKFRTYFHVINVFENESPLVGAESREGPSDTGAMGDNERFYYLALDVSF